MIIRLTINNIIKQVKDATSKKKELSAKVSKLKKELKENSAKYKTEYHKLKQQLPKPLFLDEDCFDFYGNGFNKGKEIDIETAQRLKSLGFEIIWVNDGEELKEALEKDLIDDLQQKTENNQQDEKTQEYIDKRVEEVKNLLSKCMSVIEEENAKKPGSTIKMLNGDDLLKRTIEVLQLDGAKAAVKNVFGDAGKKFISIKSQIQALFRKNISKYLFTGNFCYGSSIEPSEETKKNKKPAKPNYPLLMMMHSGLAFLFTLTNISKRREFHSEKKEDDTNKRRQYAHEEIFEGVLSSFFCRYGILHSHIDRAISKNITKLINDEDEIIENGYLNLPENIVTLIQRYSNVSHHVFTGLKNDGFIKEVGEEILQFHQVMLNGKGYPKRKVQQEMISEKDSSGNISPKNMTVFDKPISEMTRLAGIINFFCEYIFGNPFSLPVERDNLVRYMLDNREYPNKERSSEKDTEGIFDINSKFIYEKRFDGYLVDEFLKSICIYKIGEKVRICSFDNPDETVYEGFVAGYNQLPHRPIVKINKDEKPEMMDLSSSNYDNFFIGEYFPCIRFKSVLEKVAPEFAEQGITIYEDLVVDEEIAKKSKQELEREAELDAIFEQKQSDVTPLSAEEAQNVDISALLNSSKPKHLQEKEKSVEEKKQDEEIEEPKSETKDEIDNNKKENETKETEKTDTNVSEKVSNENLEQNKDNEEKEENTDEPTSPKTKNIPEKQPEKTKQNDEGGDYYFLMTYCKDTEIPYCIAEFTNEENGNKNFKVRYLPQIISEDSSSFIFNFYKVKDNDEHITVYSKQNANKKTFDSPEIVVGDKFFKTDLNTFIKKYKKNYYKGDLFILNYFKQLDPKYNKKADTITDDDIKYLKGTPKYLVQIVSKTDNIYTPKVLFVRYIAEYKKDNAVLKKDKICGKIFDLSKYRFFRLGDTLTANELIKYFKLKLI